jgi:hypothetical protein
VLEAVRGVPALSARLGAHPALAVVKFLAPVRPGSVIVIDLIPEAGPSNSASRDLRFEVRCGDVLAASGRWTPSASES